MSGSRSSLYFAYGSNMLSWRIRHPQRCANANKVSVATLEGYGLHFHKVGSDGSGKCDVVEEDAGRGMDRPSVHGVVYEVEESELLRLDGVEGSGYERREVVVRFEDGEKTDVYVYVARATAIDPEVLPWTWYRDLVAAGAEEHALEAGYADRLALQRAVEDPDREREARERQAIENWLASRSSVGD